jgi:hypothetical protein
VAGLTLFAALVDSGNRTWPLGIGYCIEMTAMRAGGMIARFLRRRQRVQDAGAVVAPLSEMTDVASSIAPRALSPVIAGRASDL